MLALGLLCKELVLLGAYSSTLCGNLFIIFTENSLHLTVA